MSDTVWLAVLGIVAMLLKEYFDHKRAGRVTKAAEEVKQVLQTTTEKHEEHLVEQDKAIGDVSKQVEGVHQDVNSKVDRLIEATRKEGEKVGEDRATQILGGQSEKLIEAISAKVAEGLDDAKTKTT